MTPDRLRYCLDAIGWSQRGLAGWIGIDDRQVRRWAAGATIPEPVAQWLERLAACHDRNPPASTRGSPMTQPLDLKLRPGETLAQRAEILGITLNQLKVLRRNAGLTVPVAEAKKPDPAEDQRIAAAYQALDVPVLYEAARRLGLGVGRLTGALERTRTARRVAPVVHVPAPVSRGWEPLPAGHAETWGVLGWGNWPGSVG